MHTYLGRLLRISLGFIISVTSLASLSRVAITQDAPRGREKTVASAPATEVTAEAIRVELKARGLSSSEAATPEGLRNAFTEYDFQARGSGLNSNKKELWEAAKNLSAALSQTTLQSHVTVRTQKSGARVWYRLIGRDTPTPFNQLTNDTADDVSIGLYYIWAERDGKATSSKEIVFRIIQKKVPVDLVEVAQ